MALLLPSPGSVVGVNRDRGAGWCHSREDVVPPAEGSLLNAHGLATRGGPAAHSASYKMQALCKFFCLEIPCDTTAVSELLGPRRKEKYTVANSCFLTNLRLVTEQSAKTAWSPAGFGRTESRRTKSETNSRGLPTSIVHLLKRFSFAGSCYTTTNTVRGTASTTTST